MPTNELLNALERVLDIFDRMDRKLMVVGDGTRN